MNATTLPKVSVSATVERQILSGRRAGESDWPKLESAVLRRADRGVVLIDLSGAEFLSSSYFDAGVWPLWNLANEDLYPVLANVPGPVADDIKIVLAAHSAAIWSATPLDLQAFNAELLGSLAPSLGKIIQHLQKNSETTAPDLASNRELEPIGPTAWSNRLALLHKQRLLRRRKDGRKLVYALPWGK